MQALHEKYDGLEELSGAPAEIPLDVTEALKHPLRDYQQKALQRFIHYFNSDRKISNHVLFEMATGAGKTLLMAGLMLYLYKQGYRNFIFFVNSTTILEKTKANFSDSGNLKYLFAEHITLDSSAITINPINNLDEANPDALNIIFTTIQGLHTTLDNPRENAVTFDDLASHKLVLLGDEAHHFQTQSKQKELELEKSWENTVMQIFKGNTDNVLLELTATAELNRLDLADKYRDKLLYKYALAEFCRAGYAKTIALIVNRSNNKYRMLLALLINQFRREVAGLHHVSLKPVILFKSSQIAESKANQAMFLEMLEMLESADIEKALEEIAMGSEKSPLIDAMVGFWQDKPTEQIAQTLKREFSQDKIMNVNDDKEKEKTQIELNSLEDKSNNIRVIFAVNKLNEGWDVLNLFDIVKLFETNSKKQTTQEAQLIGRGARYYPFSTDAHDEDYYKRKYDKQADHVLRFLETLHYHTMDDSGFITELNKQLEADGLILEKNSKEISLDLKDEFKQSDIYSKGYIFINNRLHRKDTLRKYLREGNATKDMFQDMRINLPPAEKLNAQVDINTKIEERDIAEAREDRQSNLTRTKKINEITFAIFYKALSKNEFYRFDKLGLLLGIKSMRDIYIACSEVSITFTYDAKNAREPNTNDKLQGVIAVLDKLQKALMVSEYKGSAFEAKAMQEIFKNKKITIDIDKTVIDCNGASHFAQDKFYGTSEEDALIPEIEGFLQENDDIDKAWLIRNERHFTIYNFGDGKGFQPDFVLFLEKTDNSLLTYQLFIEPKGAHIKDYDRWKEDFMARINETYPEPLPVLELSENHKQKIIGLPFYNQAQPYQFMNALEENLL